MISKMRFAEVFLRLGTGFVCWMLLYAYIFWLAALHPLGCGPDGDELHRLLLGLTPFAIASSYMLRVTRVFGDTHKMMRWFAIPLILVLPFAVRSVIGVAKTVNLDGTSLCAAAEPVTWQLMWAPAHALTLVAVASFVSLNTLWIGRTKIK